MRCLNLLSKRLPPAFVFMGFRTVQSRQSGWTFICGVDFSRNLIRTIPLHTLYPYIVDQRHFLLYTSPDMMLLIFCLLISIPAIRSDGILLSCVDPNVYSEWKTPPPSRRMPALGCAYAIHGLQLKMKSVLETDLTFYSNISSPAQAPQATMWSLPTYTQSSMSLLSLSFLSLYYISAQD